VSGTVIFVHPDRREVERMLDHEGVRWRRSLKAGDKVTPQAARPVEAEVRQLRSWRGRTLPLLAVSRANPADPERPNRVL
jgi:hypothetical protein